MSLEDRRLQTGADPSTNEAFLALHGRIDRLHSGAASEAPVDDHQQPPKWEEPTPLGLSTPAAFPVDSIPARWLKEWIESEAEATQTPPDLAGVVALGALSAACHGQVTVEARPGYRESVNIYAAVALESGNRKSAVFADATDPIYAVEAELTEERRVRVAVSQSGRRILEKSLSDAETAAAKEGGDASSAEALASKLATLEVESPTRFVVDDITPEALVSVLVDQKGVLSVLSAEGGIFDTMAGRYSNGIPNLDVWLKGHSGDKLRVDRKGKPAEVVHRPCMTLVLAVQPEVLRALGDKPGFRGKGLVARFLYSVPVSTVGSRMIAPDPVPDCVKTAYEYAISALLKKTERLTDAKVITLSEGARETLLRFEHDHEPKLARELAHLADWGGKLVGAVLRIAGLLHVAEHSDDWASQRISESTMNAAITLGDYFTSHIHRVSDVMRADPQIEGAKRILKWIIDNKKEKFSKRDAHHDLEHVFPRSDDLIDPLEVLIERGHIRSVEVKGSGVGRPPSPQFEVNPQTLNPPTKQTKPDRIFREFPTEPTQLPQRSTSVGSVGAFAR